MSNIDIDDAAPLRPVRRIRWGQVWRDRLIDQGWLDARRIRLGQGNVARTEVDGIEISAGRVSRVWNSPGTHEAVWIETPEFTPDEWETIVETVAGRAGHTAAVLDHALEALLMTELREAGVELLSLSDELEPQCGCSEKERFCSHAISLMHAFLHEVNVDPFVLFAARGRTGDQLIMDVRRVRVGSVTIEKSQRQPTMSAVEAWARVPEDEPVLPRPVTAAGTVARWQVDHDELLVEPRVLQEIAADAVERAWAMSRGDARSSLALDLDADIARRAVGLVGTSRISELAREMDEPATRVIGLATAWKVAGPGGLKLLAEEPWQPEAWLMDEAVEAIIASGKRESSVKVDQNAVTVADKVQYRYGHDQIWYRLDKRANTWMLLYPPALDIQDVFAPPKP